MPSCLPTAGTYGNLGRGVYSGPGLTVSDISLFKNIAFTERMHLQFRAEFVQYAEPREFRVAECDRVFGDLHQPTGRPDYSTATTSRQIQFGLKLVF